MRWRTRTLIAVGLTVTWSAPALACGLWFNSTYVGVPASPMFGIGIQNWFTDFTQRSFSADVNLRLGDKVAVRPGIGLCQLEAGDETESNVLFGGAVAVNLWNDDAGTLSLNGQTGFEYVSLDGASARNIPVGAALQIRNSDTMAWFAGASINFANLDIDGGGSVSDSDPSLFGGAVFRTGQINLTAGGTLFLGDDTDFALNVGASMAMGSSMNGLRRIGSLLRK